MARPRQVAAQPPTPASTDRHRLLTFWREVLDGRVTVRGPDGVPKIESAPLSDRMQASQLLAKYTFPSGKLITETPQEATATPDVLKLAEMLDKKVSDADINRLVSDQWTPPTDPAGEIPAAEYEDDDGEETDE